MTAFIHSRASLVWRRTSLKNTQKLCYQEIFHSQYESLIDTSHSTLIHQKKTIHKCFLLSVHNTYSASCYGNHISSTSVAVRQITMIVATQVYSFFVSICVSPPIKMKCYWVLQAYITEVQKQSNGWMSITRVDYWSGLLDVDYWTWTTKWTTGLTFFALKIIFMAYNKIFLLVRALCRRFLTWPPTSLAKSCVFDYVNNNVLQQQVQYSQFNDCQHSQCRCRLVS